MRGFGRVVRWKGRGLFRFVGRSMIFLMGGGDDGAVVVGWGYWDLEMRCSCNGDYNSRRSMCL